MRVVVFALFVFMGLGTFGCAGSADGGNDDASTDAGVQGCSRAKTIFAACLACHASASAVLTGGGFDMEKTGWEKNLVGHSTPATAPATALCKGKNLVWLQPNIQPAKGLFLDKLSQPMPPCGVQMPNLLPKLSAADMACVQSWANNIVSGGGGQ